LHPKGGFVLSASGHMSPLAEGDGAAFNSADLIIPDHNDKELHQLLDALGSSGKVPSALPPGWDKATASKRLSDHLALIDSEIARKMKGLEDLNTHLTSLPPRMEEKSSSNRADVSAGLNPSPAVEKAEVATPELSKAGSTPGGARGDVYVYQSHHAIGLHRQYSPPVPTGVVAPPWPGQMGAVSSPHPCQQQRLQRLASAPAGWRVVKAAQSVQPGCLTLLGSGPPRYTLGSSTDVRAGSAGPAARMPSPGVHRAPPGVTTPAPRSPVVVTSVRGSSPHARTRCASPPVFAGHIAAPGCVIARTPRGDAPVPNTSRQSLNPQPASQVGSRFILVSAQPEAYPGRCATPRRVPSRPPPGVTPGRVQYAVQTPRR